MPHAHAPLCQSTVTNRILNCVRLPSLPEAAVQLLNLCRDEGVSAGEIVRVIELDPALSTRLLRVANSPIFGQQNRVSTLTRASVVLGNENLRVAALGFYLSSGWERLGFKGFDVREFWRDSILRACLARRLAKTIGYQPAERAFLAGLLQNIGTLILGTHFGSAYADFLEDYRSDNTGRLEAETATFGTNHVEIASALAERWRFPETLVVALSRQCTEPPLTRSTDCDELFWQVSYFCAGVPFSPDRQTARVGAALRSVAYGGLGLSFESLSNVFNEVVEQFNTLRDVFVTLIPGECDVGAILREAAVLIESFDSDIADAAKAP